MRYYKYTLEHEGNILVLTNNPDGWDDRGANYVRSDIYHSILRKGTGALRFVKEGKVYIDNVFNGYGVNANIDITIEERNPITHQYDQPIFTGIIDLSTYEYDYNYTEVELIDGSIEAKFTNRDEIELNLFSKKTIDNGDVDSYIPNLGYKTIQLTPIDLYRYTDCQMSKTLAHSAIKGDREQFFLPITTLYETDYEQKTILNDPTPRVAIYYNSDSVAYDVTFKFTDCNLTGDIEFIGASNNSVNIGIYLQLFQSVGVLISSTQIGTFNISGTNSVIQVDETFSFDELINVPAGYHVCIYIDNIYIIAIAGETIEDNTIHTYGNTTTISRIKEKSDAPAATNCRGWLEYEAFASLIQQMTNQSDLTKLLYSEPLGRTDSYPQTYASDGEASLHLITNGYNIRQKDRSINISFRDLFRSISLRVPLGCWYDRINERFLIADYDAFYRKEEILDLGEVKELKIKLADDWFFNTIKTGYAKKVEYEELNGVNAINTKTEFTTVIDKFKRAIDLMSPMRGDSPGIELARRASGTSEDTKYDDDNFLIDLQYVSSILKPINGYNLQIAESVQIPGVEGYYNLRFTPKRILQTNRKKFMPGLYSNQSSVIKFSKNQQDNDCNTKFFSQPNTVNEKDDYPVTGNYNPNCFPILYDFEKPITYEIAQQLDGDPHGYVSFTAKNGKKYAGFILETGTGGYRKKGNWLLIAANIVIS